MSKYMCEELCSFWFLWNKCDGLFYLLGWIFKKDLTLQVAYSSKFLASCGDMLTSACLCLAEVYPLDLVQKGSAS